MIKNEKKLSIPTVRLLWLGVIIYFSGCAITLAHAHFEISKYLELKKIAKLNNEPDEVISPNGWDYFYYIWEAGTFIALFYTVTSLVPQPYRWIIKPALYYSIIRLLWEISFPVTGMDVNDPMIVNMLSMAMLIGVVMLLLKDLVIRWRQN